MILQTSGTTVGPDNHKPEMMIMSKTTEYTVISISQDNVWAGDGKLIDGVISDCGAQFGADQDESENVYELIEEAIEEGKDSLKVELSDQDNAVVISWTITEPA